MGICCHCRQPRHHLVCKAINGIHVARHEKLLEALLAAARGRVGHIARNPAVPVDHLQPDLIVGSGFGDLVVTVPWRMERSYALKAAPTSSDAPSLLSGILYPFKKPDPRQDAPLLPHLRRALRLPSTRVARRCTRWMASGPSSEHTDVAVALTARHQQPLFSRLMLRFDPKIPSSCSDRMMRLFILKSPKAFGIGISPEKIK